jgi:hypothetical protein
MQRTTLRLGLEELSSLRYLDVLSYDLITMVVIL